MQLAPYLVPDNLPGVLKDCLSLAKTTDEQDILLLSVLTAVSSCLPNVQFEHGHLGKVYYPNLQSFIMAGAASGKGVASVALELVKPIHEKHPLLLPGDSTYPAFFKLLAEHSGVGYMHESEGSVITDIWRSGAMSYNTALRKAAEHEPLSRNRCADGDVVIDCPRISCLLTGTFDQFSALVPSVQNGFFSRLSLLVVRSQQGFDRQVFADASSSAKEQRTLVKKLGQQLLSLYERLARLEAPLRVMLSDEQAASLGDFFEREYGALISELGPNFHPSVVRMAVTTMRIVSILSALRLVGSSDPLPEQIVCSDADFLTARLIGSKLLLHAADAFMQISGSATPSVPEPKQAMQQTTFYKLLPDIFNSAESEKIAQSMGASARSARRWLSHYVSCGKLEKPKAGSFRKLKMDTPQ